MGDFLGALAGIGMLLLIGAMIGRFVCEMGWMRRETGRMLFRITGMTLGVGAAYWLFGALIRVTLFGKLTSAAALDEIFSGPYTRMMFEQTANPGPSGPASGLAAVIGHALGALLFGQYRLGAMAAAFLLTDGAACLLYAWISGWWGEKAAERTVFLLLCMPGAVFLYLPGWAPMLLLLTALIFFLGGKMLLRRGRNRRDRAPRQTLTQGRKGLPCRKNPPWEAVIPSPAALFLSPAAYDAALCLCAFFSALTTACAALGWIG